MMSSAPLIRQPSSEESSHLGATETHALIHAVLQLSRERGLAVHTAPQYMPAPRPATPWAKGLIFAAVLLAFGGFSYWMGARQGQDDAPVAAATSTVATAVAASQPAPVEPVVATPAPVAPATATQAVVAPEPVQPSTDVQAQIDPALVQAVMAALAQSRNSAAAPSTPSPPKPEPVKAPVLPSVVAKPQAQVAAAPPKPVVRAAPAAVATQASQEPARPKDDSNGVSVDLTNLGTSQAAAPVRHVPAAPAPAPAAAKPAAATPAAAAPSAAGSFSVVGVLDGMVLVQQGRRVSPVTVGQALPDGKILHSTDSGSGKFQTSSP